MLTESVTYFVEQSYSVCCSCFFCLKDFLLFFYIFFKPLYVGRVKGEGQ